MHAHRQHARRRICIETVQVEVDVVLVLDVGAVPRVRGDELVDGPDNFLQRRRQEPVVLDVAEELLAEQHLARRQVEHLELLAEVVHQVAGLDRDRLGVLQLLVLLARAADVEAVEEDFLPVHLFFLGGRLLFLFLVLFAVRALLLFLFRFEEFEEGIDQQLLLQVLLQVHHRHVEHVHRLVEARIDAEFLPLAEVLRESCLHATFSNRALSLAVRVGPR